jgi:hypothetical protein
MDKSISLTALRSLDGYRAEPKDAPEGGLVIYRGTFDCEARGARHAERVQISLGRVLDSFIQHVG